MSFLEWWNEVGSGIIPRPGEDREEHAKRVAEAAFNAGLRDGEIDDSNDPIENGWVSDSGLP